MRPDLIANLEALLAKGGDGAALRLALAARYLDGGDAASAVKHAEAAVRLDPHDVARVGADDSILGSVRRALALGAIDLGQHALAVLGMYA